MKDARWLIVGLGNPGPEYANTRHNLGFKVIDGLSEEFDIPLTETSHSALWGRKSVGSKDIVLAKPITYMNRSGRAVEKLLRALDMKASQLIAAYDDIDLDKGKLRIRSGGGSGGHLGVESIIESLGTEDFIRVKLGVGRPPGKKEPAAYVLEPLARDLVEEFAIMVERAVDAVKFIIERGPEAAMGEINRRV